MRATLLDFSFTTGIGHVKLQDGTELSFDVSVARCPVPEIGVLVDVEIGPGWDGRTKVKALGAGFRRESWTGILLQWPAMVGYVGFIIHECSGVLREESFLFRGEPPQPAFKPGTPVQMIVEHMSGSTVAQALSIEKTKDLSAEKLEQMRLSVSEDFRRAVGIKALRMPKPLRSRPTQFPFLSDGGKALEAYPPSSTCVSCGTGGVARALPGRNEPICDACILAGKTDCYRAEMFHGYVERVSPTAEGSEKEKQAQAFASKLNRTPPVVAWAQEEDWPICCDEPADYVGAPSTEGEFEAWVSAGARLYEKGAVSAKGHIHELLEAGSPESWDEINCFICGRCGERLYTYQFT